MLAARITGRETSPFEGATLATRLKIAGVDVFSAGAFDEGEPGVETVKYEDMTLGIYKKVLLKDNRLRGVILVGDTSDEIRYKNWLRSGEDLSGQRRHLLFPPSAADAGVDVAAIADGETVCGCMGVTKGSIVEAIHKHGISTMAELKEKPIIVELRNVCRDV